MTEKQLNKMDRADLLRVMMAQAREIEALRQALGDSGKAADAPEEFPDPEQLLTEVRRETRSTMQFRGLTRLVYALAVLAAVLCIISLFWMPILEIYGSGMAPGLQAGDIVVARPEEAYERGDVVAVTCSGVIMVKRVIAVGGDTIDISTEGKVSVNGEALEETYVESPSLHPTDLAFPYEVPEGRFFLLGDNRGVSLDSRSMEVGCVAIEQINGRVLFRVWPIGRIGGMD